MTRDLQRKDIGRNLAKLRFEKGWTQEELAEKVGSNAGHISMMENGKRGIGPKMLPKLCKALSVSPNAFYGFEEEEPGKGLPLTEEQQNVLQHYEDDPLIHMLLDSFLKLPQSKKLARLSEIQADIEEMASGRDKE